MSAAIEIISYKLQASASKEDLMACNPPVESWIAAQPGFEYRALSQKEDGTWVDVVFWDSMENAKKAGEGFCQADAPKKMMALIDEGTVDMQHMSVAAVICPAKAEVTA
jgi:hypothetical protein